jgi:hypothetical protein
MKGYIIMIQWIGFVSKIFLEGEVHLFMCLECQCMAKDMLCRCMVVQG